MEGLAKWIADISWPVVSRVLAAMGLGAVTYTGASSALDGVLNAAKSAAQGVGTEMLQILAMAGFFDAMSITAGGLVGSLGWLVMKRFAMQTSGT